jgi:hypothetical protein
MAGSRQVKVVFGGNEVAVRSKRVARMIEYVVQKEAAIGSMPKGRLTFHFAGADSLKSEVLEQADLLS